MDDGIDDADDDAWDGVEALLSPGHRETRDCEVVFERQSDRDATTGTKLWVNAHAVCFVTCCKVNGASETTRSASAADEARTIRDASSSETSETSSKTASTQYPEVSVSTTAADADDA